MSLPTEPTEKQDSIVLSAARLRILRSEVSAIVTSIMKLNFAIQGMMEDTYAIAQRVQAQLENLEKTQE